MQWSWPLARVPMPRQKKPVDIRVHVSLVFLVVVLAAASPGPDGPLATVALLATVFSCVLLHELGHVVMAQFHGISTRDITLLPIGGLSHLDHLPERAHEEIVVALAGPAVNAVIALLAMMLYVVWPHRLVEQLVWLNGVLGAFNLLPAFPMDGGRILRGMLWMRTDYLTATRRAARVGRAMAMLFMVVGLMHNAMLLLVGAFVLLSATAEEQYVMLRDTCSRLQCREAADARWVAAQPHQPVSDVAARLLHAGSGHAVVFDATGVAGFLAAEDVARGKTSEVRAAMRPVALVQGTAPLTEALQKLADYDAVVVSEGDRVTSVITQSTMKRTLYLQAGLGPRASDRDPRPGGAPPQPEHSPPARSTEIARGQ